MTNPELYEAITEHWGERCSEYDPGCFCCRAWDQFDAVAELQKRLAEEKHHAEVYQASCGELAAQLSVAEAKLAAVREQYNNWMGEKQGYMQTLEAVAELAKEPTNDE